MYPNSIDTVKVIQTDNGPQRLTIGQVIIQAVLSGNFVSTAAKFAGVAPTALASWKVKAAKGIEPYVQFFADLNEAEASNEMLCVQTITKGVKAGDIRAAQLWLDIRYKRGAAALMQPEGESVARGSVQRLVDASGLSALKLEDLRELRRIQGQLLKTSVIDVEDAIPA